MRLDIGTFPVEVDVFLREYAGPAWEVTPFRHRSGWVMVSEARLETSFATRRSTLVAAVSDHGEIYSPAIAARLLELPTSYPRDAECDAPQGLEEAMEALYWDFLGAMDLENMRLLEEAEEETARKICNFEAECLAFEQKLLAAMRDLRTKRRKDSFSETQLAKIDSRLSRLHNMISELAIGLRQRTAEMRSENDALAEAVLVSLADHGEIEHLYCARWRARSGGGRRADIRLPEPREAGFVVDSWFTGMDRPTLEQVAELRVFKNDRDD